MDDMNSTSSTPQPPKKDSSSGMGKWIVIGIAAIAIAAVIVGILLNATFWRYRDLVYALTSGNLENTGIIGRFLPGGSNEYIGDSIKDALGKALDKGGRGQGNSLEKYAEEEQAASQKIEKLIQPLAGGLTVADAAMYATPDGNLVITASIYPPDGTETWEDMQNYVPFIEGISSTQGSNLLERISYVVAQDAAEKTGKDIEVSFEFYSPDYELLYGY